MFWHQFSHEVRQSWGFGGGSVVVVWVLFWFLNELFHKLSDERF